MQKKSTQKKHSHFKILLNQPLLVLNIVFIFIMLGIFIALPLMNIFKLAFIDDGVFSMVAFLKIVKNSAYQQTFINSIKLGAIVAVIATFIGFVFAFALSRTEMPGKKFFKAIATLPIISPPFVLSLSLIFLFGRQGLITKQLLGILDYDVYGLKSLVAVQSISFFPVAFMTLTGILEAIDDSVEDAAYNMGASRGHIFRTVTLPLALPGIISAMLLVFIQSLEDFSNPSVLAGNFSTLAVEAYRVITGLFDMQGGAILAIILLMPTVIAFTVQKYWVSKKSFVTVTGKPTQKRRKLHEKYIIWPLFAFCSLIAFCIIVLYGTVLMGAFVTTWGINYTFTLKHFQTLILIGFDQLRNSIVISAISAPLAGILGILIAYLVVRQRFPGRHLMEFMSMLTFAVPGTVLGIGYVLSFNVPPFLFTGTAFVLIMAFLFRNMPVSIESGVSTLLQIDPSIEEASTILGADSGTTFRNITLPLLKQAFFSGLVYAFVRGMTAVSSVIFLISPKWNLATTRVFALFESSEYSAAAAFIVIMIVFILVMIFIITITVDFIFTPKHLKIMKRENRKKKKHHA